jgi:hypothetical protein
MIPKRYKRLPEVDFPIAEVSRQAVQEWLAARQARAGETERKLQEPIQDPARLELHDVLKVAHHYLSVDALTKPVQVWEESLVSKTAS